MESVKVEAAGEAYLRNGFSQVTAVGVAFRQYDQPGVSDRYAEIFVENSRGMITNGFIWVPETAVVELAQKVLAQQIPKVRIVVKDGGATVDECPAWVDVEIVDLDNYPLEEHGAWEETAV
ncbi:MAG: hypothetical protein IT327_02960 [Anaerolineae bacterium]|nr:hypothetical protein [Anaerolineae bacterium]